MNRATANHGLQGRAVRHLTSDPVAVQPRSPEPVGTYGGFELGFAVFLWLCTRRDERVRLGLLASGCALAGSALSFWAATGIRARSA